MASKTPKADKTSTEPEMVEKRPAKFISKETLQEQALVIDERKKHALMDTHEIILNRGWKHQFDLWANADTDTKRDIIYGMVMHDGAVNIRDITRFFNIKKEEINPFNEVFEAAKVALKLKIQRNQISLGLQREDMLNLKFMLGKQFAEQVAEPAHEGVSSVQSAPPQIVVNQTNGINEELRNEMDAAVQAAMAVTSARTKH